MDRLLEAPTSSDKVTDRLLGGLEAKQVVMDKFPGPSDKVMDKPLRTSMRNNFLDRHLGLLAANKDKRVGGLVRNETFAVQMNEALAGVSRNLAYQGQIQLGFTVQPLLGFSLRDLFPHRECQHLQHQDELQYLQTHSLDLKLVMARLEARPEASNSALTTTPNVRKAVVAVAALAVVTMTAVLLQDQHTTGWEVRMTTERGLKRRGTRGKRKSGRRWRSGGRTRRSKGRTMVATAPQRNPASMMISRATVVVVE